MVVFYHAARHLKADIGYLPWGGVAQFGHAGVDFFFVLSGFIILFIHSKDIGKPAKLAHYTQRRFTRIYPMYWFASLITLILTILFSKQALPGSKDILQAFTLFPTQINVLVGVAWTLQHELIFYLMFAAVIIHARIGLMILFAWLLLIVFNQYAEISIGNGALADRLLSPFNIEFFFGMIAAYWSRHHQLANPKTLVLLGAALFISFGIAENLQYFDGYATSARLSYGLSSMLMVIGLAGLGNTQGITTSTLSSLGAASYSIYLLHLLIIGVVYKAMGLTGLLVALPAWITYLVLCSAGIVGGTIISRIIEYPLMAAVKNFMTWR